MSDTPTLHAIDLSTLYLSADLRPTYRDQLSALVKATGGRSNRDALAAWDELYRMADRADAHRNAEG